MTRKTHTVKVIIWLIALILISTSCMASVNKSEVTGTPKIDQWVPVNTDPADGTSPLEVRLIFSHIPKLNEPVDLTMMIFSKVDSPGTLARIGLPESAELLEGNPSWRGDLIAKEPVFIGARLKIIKEGDWVIEAKAQRCLGEGEDWGDIERVSLHVGENNSNAEIAVHPTDPFVCDSFPNN